MNDLPAVICAVIDTLKEDVGERIGARLTLDVDVGEILSELVRCQRLHEVTLIRFDSLPRVAELSPSVVGSVFGKCLGRVTTQAVAPKPFQSGNVAQQRSAAPEAAAPWA